MDREFRSTMSRARAVLDGMDFRILAELVENGKASYVDIGKKLLTHPNVIAYRMNRMEQSGVIRQFTSILDFEQLGLSEQVCVATNFPPSFVREDLIRQVLSFPQTLRVVTGVGSPEALIFLVCRSKEETDEVISKLRSLRMDIEFTSSIIRSYETGKVSDYLRQLAFGLESLKSVRTKKSEALSRLATLPQLEA